MQDNQSSTELRAALIGTTGESLWKQAFYDAFYQAFPDAQVVLDPALVPDGYPPASEHEAYALGIEHDLARADVVIVAVTGETYGIEELGVLGFALAEVMGTEDRAMLVYVEQEVDEALTDPVAREQSERARRLAVAYLRQLRLANVEVTDSLDALLEASSRTLQELNARA